MATPVQRSTSIVTGLIDGTPSAQLLTRIGDAYAYTYRRGVSLTAAEKAAVFINAVRQQVKQIVLDAEESQVKANAVTEAAITIDIGSDA